MIKDYLYTIGKYLSPAQKDEVLKEIEANLYDYLEENFGTKEYAEEEIEKAIKSMGHPRKVAEAYMNGPRCLIGPAYIDTYWLVLKIAFIGTAIGLTVANILALPEAKDGIQFFLKLLAQFWQSALSIVGMVTLIFAAIHYYRPHDVIVNDEQWSLSSLDKAPEPTQTIKRFDLIVETFFICLGLVVINQSTPFFTVDINTVVIPMIHMEYFAPYIIGINLLLGASLLLNMYLLFKGQWQAQTRVLSSFLDILGILLVAKLIFTPEIWDFSTISTALGEDADRILQLVQTGIYIGFAVFVIITLYEVFRHLKVLLESKKS